MKRAKSLLITISRRRIVAELKQMTNPDSITPTQSESDPIERKTNSTDERREKIIADKMETKVWSAILAARVFPSSFLSTSSVAKPKRSEKRIEKTVRRVSEVALSKVKWKPSSMKKPNANGARIKEKKSKALKAGAEEKKALV